jgi:outer membrane protein TolC
MIKTAIKLITIILFIDISIYGQVNKNVQLDSLVTEVIQDNPQLKAARSQTLSERTKIEQATAWEPPQVGIIFYQTPIQYFPNPIRGGMETDYFIQQTFPFPGKLGNMGDAASNNTSMFEQQYKELVNKIIEELKNSYYELYFVDKKIEINRENQSLLKQLTQITAKQYEVGNGTQADMLRAQTELSTLNNEGVNLLKEKKDVETMLNTILSRPINSVFPAIGNIQESIPAFTYDQLSDMAFQNRPELKAMQYNIEMNKSELKASKLEYYPDFMVQLMYKNLSNTPNDFWSAMVGVDIPLAFWSKDKVTGKVEENEININTAQERLNAMKNMIASEVQSALIKIEANINLIELYKNSSIPQAEQTLQSTLSAYQTGKTEFLMLIDAYKMVLMTKLDYYMAEMNYMQSQAQLEQAVGLNINQIEEKIK